MDRLLAQSHHCTAGPEIVVARVWDCSSKQDPVVGVAVSPVALVILVAPSDISECDPISDDGRERAGARRRSPDSGQRADPPAFQPELGRGRIMLRRV